MLVETCKLCGINPQAYLTDVLTRIILRADTDPINDLLPYNWVDSRCAGRSSCSSKFSNPAAMPKSSSCELQSAWLISSLFFCILSWRIFWMTMLNRALPSEIPVCALTLAEISVIDQIAMRAGRTPAQIPKLTDYLCEIARLGGYLTRRHDPPPGNMIMWRGWSRLMDIQLGVELAAVGCG
jgi:hypothetical protein